jgi:hypothetical protein
VAPAAAAQPPLIGCFVPGQPTSKLDDAAGGNATAQVHELAVNGELHTNADPFHLRTWPFVQPVPESETVVPVMFSGVVAV